MKSRLFVVNDNTYYKTISTNEVSIKIPSFSENAERQHWVKTIYDIMADLLQVQIGDYIFFWKQKESGCDNGIYGVYRAISKPYYRCDNDDDEYPFKMRIQLAYEFKNPVSEYEVLNNPFNKEPFWNIIGKKVAGKARGTTPLTQEETKRLILLLLDKNPEYKYYPYSEENNRIENYLSVDFSIKRENTYPRSISSFNPNQLSPINSQNNFRYEKILETVFNQEMQKNNKDFFKQMDITLDNVIWYSNYLPYSIEGKEMDYIIIESLDGCMPNKITVIDFIKDKVDEEHIDKVFLYSKWVSETLALGTNIVQPMLISYSSYDYVNGETDGRKKNAYNRLSNYIEEKENTNKLKPLKIFQYKIINDVINFEKKK